MRTQRLIVLSLLWLPLGLQAATLDLAEVRRHCRATAIEDKVMADDIDQVVRECVRSALVGLGSTPAQIAGEGDPLDPEDADLIGPDDGDLGALNDDTPYDPGDAAGAPQYDDQPPDQLEVPPEGDQEPASLDN